MAGVWGKSDTEARSPAVSMISATLARSGPGESLGGQVILGPHHARGASYRTSASHNFTGQRNAISGRPDSLASRDVAHPLWKGALGEQAAGAGSTRGRSQVSGCRPAERRIESEVRRNMTIA